jgi:hypothetical protein
VPGALRHTADVRVDREHRPPEREGRDGVGGVAADAGKLRQIVRPAARRDALRRPVEIDGAPVVSEPLPGPDDVGERGRGERLRGRPALEPLPETRDDALDLRLLEHDLGDEDRVGVAAPAPGEVAAVLAKPGQERGVHARTVPL